MMNRREILRYVAYTTGAAVSAPFASAFLLACDTDTATAAEVAAPPYEPKFFSREQYDFITKVADTIIPRTDTPGASDVGVPEVIDRMVGDVYGEEIQAHSKLGLDALRAKLDADNAATEGGFMALDDAAALTYLQGVDAAYKDPELDWSQATEEEQILMGTYFELKQMVIAHYFGSEEVATTQLAYDPIPGGYIPCGDLQELSGGKAWAI
ncbi:MAG: gluconate 2-dehydrogenase subunit 3 family protein [Bacteroidota bacterium]